MVGRDHCCQNKSIFPIRIKKGCEKLDEILQQFRHAKQQEAKQARMTGLLKISTSSEEGLPSFHHLRGWKHHSLKIKLGFVAK